MMPAQKTIRKPYIPHVRMVAGKPGCYTVQSERYTYILYDVDARAGTCTCEGHATWGKLCKHIRAGQKVYAMHQGLRQPRPVPATGAVGLTELYG